MTDRIRRLFLRMIEFDRGEPELIQHFTKVAIYCRLIADGEGLDRHTAEVLEAAALVHDIAIPLCNRLYGSHPGHLQEKEGPALARSILGEDFSPQETERVCQLVGEHHTYAPIDGLDHQILIEADFLVNSFENQHPPETLQNTWRNIFATPTGRSVYALMFGLREDGQA